MNARTKIKIQQVVSFVTTDGNSFEDIEDAVFHQVETDLMKEIEKGISMLICPPHSIFIGHTTSKEDAVSRIHKILNDADVFGALFREEMEV